MAQKDLQKRASKCDRKFYQTNIPKVSFSGWQKTSKSIVRSFKIKVLEVPKNLMKTNKNEARKGAAWGGFYVQRKQQTIYLNRPFMTVLVRFVINADQILARRLWCNGQHSLNVLRKYSRTRSKFLSLGAVIDTHTHTHTQRSYLGSGYLI